MVFLCLVVVFIRELILFSDYCVWEFLCVEASRCFFIRIVWILVLNGLKIIPLYFSCCFAFHDASDAVIIRPHKPSQDGLGKSTPHKNTLDFSTSLTVQCIKSEVQIRRQWYFFTALFKLFSIFCFEYIFRQQWYFMWHSTIS
jgi:hypothetical protein